MTRTPDRPEADGPIRWANVFLWQMSGAAVGAMVPVSTLALAYALAPSGQEAGLLCIAPVLVLAGMAVGGTIGTAIGLRDRAPTFGLKRRKQR